MAGVLKDKVAIVTGAGRGLGKVFALRYAGENARLLLPDISLERSEKTAQEIRDMGGQAVAMETDISDEKATQRIADKVVQLYGKVDILLNNAALSYGVEPQAWDAWTTETWDRMFDVNTKGTWLCCKAIAPLMVKQSKGKIINIVSNLIKLPKYNMILPYSCSKAATFMLTTCLAAALGPSGINVNAIAPGANATEANLIRPDVKAFFERVVAGQSLKRREEPEDLAGAAVFLASDDSDFVTGQLLTVDGGTSSSG